MTVSAPSSDDRVVLLAPTRRDAQTATVLLREADIEVAPSTGFRDALAELGRGAAAFIIPEEAITPIRHAQLLEVLREQPAWSDLPLLVLARAGVDSTTSSDVVRTLGNVTLLERPLRVATLVSAVRTAIRARLRQYQIRDQLAARDQAETALRQADRRKDEFLATLGHELRNPLSPIVSALHLLRLDGVPEKANQHALAVIERQVSHLTGLVDDLLEVSRITRGLVDIRHDAIDLVAAVRGAVETVRPAIARAGHRLELDLPATPVAVSGDLLRLTQVFANLLTNATKYTDAGGHIRVTVRVVNGRVVTSVRDSGIGIAAHHLETVFDMFMQIDRAHRLSQGGLGIGLTLVKSLIDLHGGYVEARSGGLGMGSEFLVDLPVLHVSIADRPPALEPRRLPGLRVLVVDDNVDAAETLAALLESLGATIRIAHNGASALAILDAFTPSAMLLDIGMPHMDGHELARRIRVRPEHRDTILIALTGWGQDQDVKESREAGFDHHVVKPPDVETLLDLLSTAVEQAVGPAEATGPSLGAEPH
jgi:signal transduction histidine kinase/CheY-like chemotaxis protein